MAPMPRTHRSIRTGLAALAAASLLLVLSGCTDAPDPDPAAEPPGPVQVPITAPGSPNPTTAPSPEAELEYFDAATLKGAVQQWATATPGTVVNDHQTLNRQLPQAQKWLAGITVSPAECGLYGIGSLKDQLAQAAMAAALLPQDAGGVLTVASYRDRAALVADVAVQQHLDASCGTYTVTGNGQKIVSKLSRLEASSSAPYTWATMLESVNGKARSRQVSIRVIDGNLMLTATRAVKATPEAAAAQALRDAEDMLGILRSVQPAATPAP